MPSLIQIDKSLITTSSKEQIRLLELLYKRSIHKHIHIG